MPLEPSVTNISDLNKAWPTGADPASISDDNHRNIKTALVNDFAGFTGAILVTGVDGGVVNAYTLTPATPLPAYTPKMIAEFSPIVTSTGAVTLNISGLGPKNVISVSGAPLNNNDLVSGFIYAAVYDGTSFRLLSITKNYADNLSFSAVLPGQTLGLLQSNGTVASFAKSLLFGLNFAKAADVASSATPDIWGGDGNLLHITGTVGMNGLAAAPQPGAWRWAIFDGAVPLTTGANFIVHGGANYTTAAGDMALFFADTTTKFYVLLFPADGNQVKATPYMKVSDTRANGTGGGGSSVANDPTQTRTLNTVDSNNIPGASLAANTITLPAGTYDIRGRAPAMQVSRHQATLYNSSDAVTAILGSNELTTTSTGIATNSTFCGRFTITSAKNFTVRHYTEAANVTAGLGAPSTSGTSTLGVVYTEVEIWKVA